MPPLTCQTAGESHGPCVLALVNGLPAGLAVDLDFINHELRRRQGGYGRGARQRIEQDEVVILSGVRRGRTIGSPVALQILNRDARLDDPVKTPPVHRPRPGHADLAGSIKWLTTDCRETLERASARETAARVAAGALARLLLREFGIETFGFVRSIHEARMGDGGWGMGGGGQPGPASPQGDSPSAIRHPLSTADLDQLRAARDASEVYCPDATVSAQMIEAIHRAATLKDTVGGIVETHILNCPIGLGSCMNWQEKLDGRLAWAVMSIQAIKGVEIGLGFEATRRFGSEVHDPIELRAQSSEVISQKSDNDAHAGQSPGTRVPGTSDQATTAAQRHSPTPNPRPPTPALGFTRPTNNAGGLEGGMTNGQPIIIRAAMKPISTLLRGLPSVDLTTRQPQMSQYERSDICAVPACSVVMEHVAAFEFAAALREKFAGDTLREMRAAYEAFLEMARGL